MTENIFTKKEIPLPSFQKSILGFIDILGFSKRFIENKNDDQNALLTLLIEFSKHTGDGFHKKSDNQNQIRASITCCSDSIFISSPVTMENENYSPPLQAVLLAIANFAYECLCKGYLLRGTITCGKLYHKNSVIIGESLVKAVNNEKKVAKYPRIILSECFLAFFNEVTEKNHSSNYNSYFKKDKDGEYYFDYLLFYYETSHDDMMHAEVTKKMIGALNGESVKKCLKTQNLSSTDCKIKEKLDYANNYINEFLRRSFPL